MSVRLTYHPETRRHYAHFYLACRLDGVTVAMNNALTLANNLKVVGAEHANMAYAILKLAAEETVGHGGGLCHRERLYHRHIHQPVSHGGIGCDIGIVAILRGISQGNAEGLVGVLPLLIDDGVSLGLILGQLDNGFLHVSQQTALGRGGEAITHVSIVAHAAGAEEGTSIDESVVNVHTVALVDHTQSLTVVERYLEMAGQPVAATAGYYAKHSLGMNQ